MKNKILLLAGATLIGLAFFAGTKFNEKNGFMDFSKTLSKEGGLTLISPEGISNFIKYSDPVCNLDPQELLKSVKEIGEFGVSRGIRIHNGVDLPAKIGEPVCPIDRGLVIYSDNLRLNGGNRNIDYGNTIIIVHPQKGIISLYAHLNELTVKESDYVFANQQIGAVGMTGNLSFAKGQFKYSHLHFELFKGNPSVDDIKTKFLERLNPRMIFGFMQNGENIELFKKLYEK